VINTKDLHVMVCPLNWGLGHASRCIPLITLLISKGIQVTIGASGRPLYLLRQEFPGLEFIEFPGFSPTYPKSGMMVGRLFLLIPSFIYNLIFENCKLSKVLKLRKFDIVISDNRYGLINKKSICIIIIHQLQILAPYPFRWLQPFLRMINNWLISRFNRCWIPDFEDENNLSGILSHAGKLPENASFIGPLTRFHSKTNADHTKRKGIVAILSGPEPQRSILESMLLDQLPVIMQQTTVICGKSEEGNTVKTFNNIKLISSAGSHEIEEYLANAELVICRPGYSTIMDLSVTGGKALFIPTPGQTEQEYLASFFMQKGIAFAVKQDLLDLRSDISKALSFKGFESAPSHDLLDYQIELLLNP
jgi:uncharacterized protein (TIGR00661 family)